MFKHRVLVENTTTHLNVPVGCTGRYGEKEGLHVGGLDGFIKHVISLVSQDICDVFPLVAPRCLSCKLKCAVQIIICERVEQEVLAGVGMVHMESQHTLLTDLVKPLGVGSS